LASQEVLRALPAQLIATGGSIIIVRGIVEVLVSGDQVADIVSNLFSWASGRGLPRSELIERFAPDQRDLARTLIDQLIHRSILVKTDAATSLETDESSLDIFYWHFGQTASAVAERMSEKSIGIMGVNTISRRIATSLQSIAARNFRVVDFAILRNQRLFSSEGDLLANEWPGDRPLSYEEWKETLTNEEVSCVVATSDFGAPQLMREWNRFCIANDVHFLPVVLDRFIGTVGPFVIPGQTPCYECARIRENANMDSPAVQRIADFHAAERQLVIGFHPAMSGMLGELAALELCKAYGGAGIPWRPSYATELNVLTPSLTTRRVLKVPLCPSCSDARRISAMDIESFSLIPGTADRRRNDSIDGSDETE
jgi:molybdopterin-synthase adenylyltransferase